MAQPNVVREPSMEEILASIRRIIESNDPGAGQSISASVPPVYAEDDDEGDSGEIHLTVDNDNAFAEELAEPPQAVSTPEPPQPAPDNVRSIEERRSLSLADVAARVRAASDRQNAQRRSEAESPAASVRPMELRGTPATHEAARPVALVQKRAADSPVDVFGEEALEALSRVIQPLAEMAPEQPVQAVAEEEFEAPMETASKQAEETASPETAQALISADASERVARSFEDLVTAFDAHSRRSLDEVAQEMLRPMLKEWLDDNLPTLVERLVREEIERVARGPRR